MGLDPGMGWIHRDAPYRDSAALDVLEAIRPDVDSLVLELLSERAFSRLEFVESPNGHVRLAPSLASELASHSLERWQRRAGPIAEEIARLVASSAAHPVRVRTRLTQADRRRAEGHSAARSMGEFLRLAAAAVSSLRSGIGSTATTACPNT